MYGGPSVVAGQAVIRGVLLPMTVHAIPHIEVDIALRNRLVRDVAMARRAFDAGADVRRVIEPDVRTVAVAVDTLPVEIDPLLGHLRDLLNARLVGGDGRVADQAGVDAGEAGLRPLRDGLMAVLRAGETLFDVGIVRELDRLLGLRADAEVFVHRPAEGVVRGGEPRIRQLARGGVGRSIDRRGPIVEPAAAGTRDTCNDTEEDRGVAHLDAGFVAG